MCRRRDDEQPWCYRHASGRFEQALTALDRAQAKGERAPSSRSARRVQRAQAEMHAAGVLLAATGEGFERVEMLVIRETGLGHPDLAARWCEIARRGLALRDAQPWAGGLLAA